MVTLIRGTKLEGGTLKGVQGSATGCFEEQRAGKHKVDEEHLRKVPIRMSKHISDF